MSTTLSVRVLDKPTLVRVLPEIARLRITVFRDWPYLYDGDQAYEERYLRPYLDSDAACVVGAFDGEKLVGAATATPLSHHADDFATAFAATGRDLGKMYYCAESVLLRSYRGQGVGHRFFDMREAAASRHGFEEVCFASVIRPEHHPAKPAHYRALDGFWRSRGYAPLPGVIADFSWKDVGDAAETQKQLQFWHKLL